MQRLQKRVSGIGAAALALALAFVLGAPMAGAGGIAGTVLDAVTHAPLANIDLDLFDSNWTPVALTGDNTDGSGNYLLSPIPAGAYYLRCDPSAAQGYVDRYYPGVFLQSQAQTVTVGEFGTIIVNFELDRGWTISGRVLDAGGLPLAGVDLDSYAADGSFIPSIDATSAADGSYLMGCYPAGTFFMKADPVLPSWYVIEYYSGHRDLSQADPIQITGTGNVSNINFHLALGGAIGGTIRRQGDGAPLAGIDIDIYDALGNRVSYVDASSQVDGTYLIGALDPGDYYVRADPTPGQGYVGMYYPGVLDISLATRVHVAAGSTVQGIDIALPLGGTIQGTLRRQGDGLPLGGIDVDIYDALGDRVPYGNAHSNADGTYLIGALLPGDYYVRADAQPAQPYVDTFYPGVYDISLATLVHVTAGSSAPGIDIPLPSGGTIAGRVTSVLTGQPVADTFMTLFDSTGQIMHGAGASTAADGTFLVGAVPTGNYRLRCYGDAVLGLAFEFYPGVTLLSQAQNIPVTAGANTPNINFTLDPAGRIAGRVRSSRVGQPLAGVDLNVYSLAGEYVGALDATTDATGAYLLERVRGGDFVVMANPLPLAPYRDQYYFRKETIPEANPVHVIPAQTTSSIDFYLYSTLPGDADEGEPGGITDRLGLRGAPNPAGRTVVVSFRLPAAGPVRLGVYDLAGRLESILADGVLPAGERTLTWHGVLNDGRLVPNGIHFLRLEAGGRTEWSRLTILR